MAFGDWDIVVWRRADDLRRQAERIQRNFLQMAVADSLSNSARPKFAVGSRRSTSSRQQTSLWVISAVPGVTAKDVKVELDGNELVIAVHA